MGDGRAFDIVVAGDKLSNAECLIKLGSELPLPSSIKHCRDVLSHKLLM